MEGEEPTLGGLCAPPPLQNNEIKLILEVPGRGVWPARNGKEKGRRSVCASPKGVLRPPGPVTVLLWGWNPVWVQLSNEGGAGGERLHSAFRAGVETRRRSLLVDAQQGKGTMCSGERGSTG